MLRSCLTIIPFMALLISLFLGSGCAKTMPTATTQATPTAIPPIVVLPSTAHMSTTLMVTAVPTISISDAANMIKNNKDNPDFIVIDVRMAEEFNSGHLANVVNIDYNSPYFKLNMDQLDRNTEYLIYCRTGIRGAAATRIMLDLGFTKVHNLTGGIVQWISDGHPIMK